MMMMLTVNFFYFLFIYSFVQVLLC